MKNILVPTDFSDISENALKLAVDIGRHSSAEIFLVNFMEHPFGSTFSSAGDTTNSGDAESDLFTLQLARKNHQRLSDLSKKHGQSVKINYQVNDHEYSKGFKTYIKEQNIDLVVMGTSGEESAEELFTGNHTMQMIEGATCPVISVKDTYTYSDFNHIVVGVDLVHDRHDNFTQAAAYLNEFAKAVHGHLHLVHVADLDANKSDLEKRVNAFAQKYGFENYTVTITQNDNKEQGLVVYSLAKKADLVAILTHAQSSMLRMFTKSTAEEVAKSSSLPVMAINLHNI